MDTVHNATQIFAYCLIKQKSRLKRPLRLALSSILTLSILYNVLGCMWRVWI